MNQSNQFIFRFDMKKVDKKYSIKIIFDFKIIFDVFFNNQS